MKTEPLPGLNEQQNIPGTPEHSAAPGRRQLKQGRDLLQTVFDTSLIGMAVHEAVRDENGAIEDFRIMFVNKELEKLTGRTDLVGEFYSKVYPGIKSTGLYDLMLEVMESGKPGQMEYAYPHDGFDKWFSSMFVKMDDGLVATNMDITGRKQAEQEKIQLIASQNKKVFWATLNAQETERKRIAESLHNSLGQSLYGAKLSLEQLDLNAKQIDLEGLKKVKQTTLKLLLDAIEESRRISHELTPAILENFGLKEALDGICQQFSRRDGIVVNCQLTGFLERLDKPLEIVIYRTVQEPVTNVIKHAQASKATIKVEVSGKAVDLMVSDNGIGFSGNGKSDGIGLKTIRSKVKLLSGKFNLSSGGGKDTTVAIRIPYSKKQAV